MRDIDVWFSRTDEDKIYCFYGLHQEPPERFAGRVKSVGEALARLRQKHNVVQVGIVPPDMIGIE